MSLGLRHKIKMIAISFWQPVNVTSPILLALNLRN